MSALHIINMALYLGNGAVWAWWAHSTAMAVASLAGAAFAYYLARQAAQEYWR